jgi:hypothetical protein
MIFFSQFDREDSDYNNRVKKYIIHKKEKTHEAKEKMTETVHKTLLTNIAHTQKKT